MENMICKELRARGFGADAGVVELFEKNAGGIGVRKQTEIGFVCNQGARRYYILSAFALPDRAKTIREKDRF